MRLGGWTRLWVVIGALYMLFVGAAAASWFPRETNVPRSAIYARMRPTETKKLFTGHEFMPQGTRKMSASGGPLQILTDDELKALANDPRVTTDDLLLLTSSELTRMNAIIDALPDDKYLAKSRRALTVDMPNGQLNFPAGTPSAEKAAVTSAYHDALRRELLASRVRFSAYAFFGWLVPWLTVYALGWSAGWIRRGFKQAQ